MPTISTTARRLRAYQATLDRRARPARPTTASRRCAPAGDGTLHALLTVSAYFTLAYIYVVIGSIDLLTSIEVPRTTFAVLYPVYLTLTPATLRPLPSFDIPQLQHPERHILHPCKCSAPAYCYLSGLMSDLLFRIFMHCFPLSVTATLTPTCAMDSYQFSVQSNPMTRVASAPHKLWPRARPPTLQANRYNE